MLQCPGRAPTASPVDGTVALAGVTPATASSAAAAASAIAAPGATTTSSHPVLHLWHCFVHGLPDWGSTATAAASAAFITTAPATAPSGLSWSWCGRCRLLCPLCNMLGRDVRSAMSSRMLESELVTLHVVGMHGASASLAKLALQQLEQESDAFVDIAAPESGTTIYTWRCSRAASEPARLQMLQGTAASSE